MINGTHDNETTVRELTMILMYLTRFHDLDRLSNPEPFYAWKYARSLMKKYGIEVEDT